MAQESPVILALPRGGVPVAFEVAQALDAPLDVVLVRKIGAPGHEELALGAVVDGDNPQVVINDDVRDLTHPSPQFLEEAKTRQFNEIERRRALYRGDRPAEDVAGKTVLIVDDGIATGATVRAALRGVRQHRPRHLVLAVPVAPAEVIETLRDECDQVLCLSTPSPFTAVGQHYDDFDQVSDAEVVRLLEAARGSRNAHPPS